MGPEVQGFEREVAEFQRTKHAFAVANGTAALHLALLVLGINRGDEIIQPATNFVAAANMTTAMGATPVFADIISLDEPTIDPTHVEQLITAHTKAVIVMHYGGYLCRMRELLQICRQHKLYLIEDACHAIGAACDEVGMAGSIGDIGTFSFFSNKNLATGEGGMVTTDRADYAETLRRFRNHGISSDARQRQSAGQWHYEMVLLGFNYRLTDMACALGLSQLKKLEENLTRRREIADRYAAAFHSLEAVTVPAVRPGVDPAWHLYPIRLNLEKLKADRTEARGTVFRALRAENIGVNVHYIPVHLHPYYRDRLGHRAGEYPVAENAYERLISLPMFHGMSDQDIEDVIRALQKVIFHFAR